MTTQTHVLITRAPVDRVATAIGVPVPVGRFGGWTVAAMDLAIAQWPVAPAGWLSKGTGEIVLGMLDLGDVVGVACSTKGRLDPLMWSASWRRPSNRILDRSARLAWEEGAKTLAKRAGHSEIAKELGALRNPGDGTRESLERMLSGAIRLLGIPEELRGVHAGNVGPLTDIVVGRRSG